MALTDREFFDVLYAQWTKLSGGEHCYWATEQDTARYDAGPGTWNVWAVDKDDNRSYVANFAAEADADWLAALHGCFGDIVRRLHAALDAEEASEIRADEAVQDQFKLACELAELHQQLDVARSERDTARAYFRSHNA